jgi:ATP-dependent Clp protease ATP-binding subunit ClpC
VTVFERFTDQARRAVVLAQEEARLLNHNYVGTEHLLLGLIHDGDGVAAQALQALGISLDDVRADVEATIGRGAEPARDPVPFTPRTREVLELALRESRQLGDNSIGTEHLLLGLIREGDGVAVHILVGRGLDLNRLRQRVMDLPQGYAGATSATEDDSADFAARLDSIAARLVRVEHHLGNTRAR